MDAINAIPEGWVEAKDNWTLYFKKPICCHAGEAIRMTTTFTWVPDGESGKWYAHDIEGEVVSAEDYPDEEQENWEKEMKDC